MEEADMFLCLATQRRHLVKVQNGLKDLMLQNELLKDSITLQSYKICHYQPVLLDKMVLYVVSESSFL